MLQSLNILKSNSHDVCVQLVNVLIKIIDNIINHPYVPKFRRILLDSNTIQNKLLPFVGPMEFLFEIGFVEDGNSLVLPDSVSPTSLTSYRQLLLNIVMDNNKFESLPLKSNNFLKQISSTSLTVLKLEDKLLQSKALKHLPPEDIESYSNLNHTDTDAFYHEQVMLRLMKWFKESFFTWFDTPTCQQCSSTTKFKRVNYDIKEVNANYAEIYECDDCNSVIEFKRYGICEELLETRKGRCGEWAECFTLFCRALGWEARLVVDKTDHVWTEVWSVDQYRWIHCDPCETALDKPLLYEKGWGKKLSYVLAYSNEEVQDVTWRYTENSADVLKRRLLCSETELLNTILSLSGHRQSDLPLSRCKYLAERRLKECVELLFQPKITGNEHFGGRTSGSLSWRLARGEIQTKKFIWTPTKSEIANKKFKLQYSTAMDKYEHDGTTYEGWQNGVYSYSSLFRKKELDWKQVYLCREENCEKSTIEWQFDFTSSGLVVQYITLMYTTTLYNSGLVEWKLLGNGHTVNLPVVENTREIIVDEISGSDFVTLSSCLSGGSGELAWQHTQLFRQPINDQEYPFQISFSLKKK